MRVSGVRDLAHAQAFHGSVGGAEASILPTTWPELLRSTHRQRGFGDFYQHVLVAEGAGEIAFDPALKAWDAAPLAIIAEEAGGAASALDGTRSIYAGSLLTTNGVLHELVRSRLAETAAGTGA
jgi:histidinol-phosphatase